MAKSIKYSLLFLAGCLAAVSCSKDHTGNGEVPGSRSLQEITVFRAPLAAANADSGSDAGSDTGSEAKPPRYDGEEIYDTEFKPGKSTLYVSQRTRLEQPFKPSSDGTTNVYTYIFYDNKNANWDEGYNFAAYTDEDFKDLPADENPNALNWDDVGRKGSVGNGFALYALYYPGREYGIEDDYNVRSVKENQSSFADLMSSDIMGAYHSTSALYSRVRFRLYHMMVYVKVNLYVPVYKPTRKDEKESEVYSGYTQSSLTEAQVTGVCPKFTIDWAASISSDAASPAVNLDPMNPTQEHLKDIKMYSHVHDKASLIDETVNFDKDGNELPEDQKPGNGDDGNGEGGETGNGEGGETGNGEGGETGNGEGGETGNGDGDGGEVVPGGGDNTGGEGESGEGNGDNGGDDSGEGGGDNGGDEPKDPENPGEPEEPEEPDYETATEIYPARKTWVDIVKFLPQSMLKIQPLPSEKDSKDKNKIVSMKDEVYVYSFSVIIPAQYAGFETQDPGFLKFSFEKPSTHTHKNYYFSGSFEQPDKAGSIGMTKGTLQVLNLYLPRKGDELILVGAEIQDWTDVETDMNLPEQERDNQGPGTSGGNTGNTGTGTDTGGGDTGTRTK